MIVKSITMKDLNVEGLPIGIDVKGNMLLFATTSSLPYIYALPTHQFPL